MLKRVLDVIVSATLLLILLPLMALMALAIVVDSRGPVLYRGQRVGQHGRSFSQLKFRKMYRDAGGFPLSTAGDTRYTRVGRWLASSKLDEIPQLWNVLVGEMSLVGPRPEDPAFVAERRLDYETILAVKQGITGLSQLAFFDEAWILDGDDPLADYRTRIWPQKIALDRMYVEHATLAWDLQILCWTAASVVLRRPIVGDCATGQLRFRRLTNDSAPARLDRVAGDPASDGNPADAALPPLS